MDSWSAPKLPSRVGAIPPQPCACWCSSRWLLGRALCRVQGGIHHRKKGETGWCLTVVRFMINDLSLLLSLWQYVIIITNVELPASNDAFSCRTGDLRTERFWSAAPFTRWPAVRPKDLSKVQSFFINALQFLFSWTTNVSGIKRWQMHLEMDRSLRVNGITGWLAQSDVGFSRTNVPLGRTWQTKKHGMAKVAPALYVRRRQVDDILRHLFNPIPIRRFDESPQCWHACFDSGRPWLTMKYHMNLFNVQKSSLIAEEQCYLHQFFICIDNFSLRRALSACLGGHWSKCISRNWTGRGIWWSFLFWIFFHGQQAIVVACCSLGNSGVEEIHGHGTVGALQGNPQAPGNRGIGRVFILGVQELQESLTALRVQKEVTILQLRRSSTKSPSHKPRKTWRKPNISDEASVESTFDALLERNMISTKAMVVAQRMCEATDATIVMDIRFSKPMRYHNLYRSNTASKA